MTKKTTTAKNVQTTEARYATDVDEWRAGPTRPDLDLRSGPGKPAEDDDTTEPDTADDTPDQNSTPKTT